MTVNIDLPTMLGVIVLSVLMPSVVAPTIGYTEVGILGWKFKSCYNLSGSPYKKNILEVVLSVHNTEYNDMVHKQVYWNFDTCKKRFVVKNKSNLLLKIIFLNTWT